MRFNKLIVVLLFFVVFIANEAFSFQPTAEEQEIISLLDERELQIKNLLGPAGTTYTDEQVEELTAIINDIVDYSAMARIALQETFYSITEEERQHFVDVFSSIIRQQSLSQLDIYRAEVTYTNIEVAGDSALVETTASLEDVTTPVSYEMERRNGEWLITDMAVDNVWTAESYRRSFQNQIRRRGFEGLMAGLERRAARE